MPYSHHAGDPFRGAAPALPGEVNIAVSAGGAGGRDWWMNTCGRNCTTNADCTAPAATESNCTCLAAQSSQYQPGVGTVAFVAACIVSLAGSGSTVGGNGIGGKRSEETWPCPCNGSYVSYGCCGAGDGVVWEGEKEKLGVLVGGGEI